MRKKHGVSSVLERWQVVKDGGFVVISGFNSFQLPTYRNIIFIHLL